MVHPQRLPRPPCHVCARQWKPASVPFPLFDLFGWLWQDIKLLMSSVKLLRDGRTFRWMGHDYHVFLPRYKSNVGVTRYSPASLHPSSDSRNRCSLPGQIWTWEDRRLRPHHTAAGRAKSWWMFGSGHVPHPWTRLSDQERICQIQQIHARSENCCILRWNSNGQGHWAFVQQGYASTHHCCDPRPNECFGPREEAPNG